ncbi:Glyoxalase/bleomycin resistance protein/dioxygenase [Methylocella tundrae]|uniref:Glyoxalase/bleomycin resistance protein/dioxygenase n=1 Tax=Methylocella tundrae TaxID=227605 RepID=A0A8B6M6V3_METTU|nr:VOC family protein [Methylocella tundrae]VTZ50566.1 Glyoxalase/bleomycin resistance protein/dioxygenase [Methylocella tundrae]
MPRLTGPDFIAIQTEDLHAAKAFYGDRLGLPVLQETPESMVFDSKPAPFAVRKPLVDLDAAQGRLGWGVALWFGCDDADALHEELKAAGIAIAFPPKDGPFGRYFAFRDPFGYTITVHTA